MKCPMCKNILEKGFYNAKRVVNGEKLVVLNVPSLNCKHIPCGMVLIDSLETEKLDQINDKIKSGEICPSNGIIDFKDYFS